MLKRLLSRNGFLLFKGVCGAEGGLDRDGRRANSLTENSLIGLLFSIFCLDACLGVASGRFGQPEKLAECCRHSLHI